MVTPSTEPVLAPAGDSVRPAAVPAADWRRAARTAGLVAGACLAGQTVLFLLDETGLLAESPDYVETSAGRAADLATYYAAFFAYQHDILWDIAVRDTLGPIAYLALMVVALSAANVLGPRRMVSQLVVLFFVVGGLLAALSDLVYLTTTIYWRQTGWEAAPTENMIAAGRSAEAINAVTTYPQYAGFTVLALGLLCVARAARTRVVVSTPVGLLAVGLAAALLGIVVAEVVHLDTVFEVLALVAGVLLAPAVAIGLGRDVARAASHGW